MNIWQYVQYNSLAAGPMWHDIGGYDEGLFRVIANDCLDGFPFIIGGG